MNMQQLLSMSNMSSRCKNCDALKTAKVHSQGGPVPYALSSVNKTNQKQVTHKKQFKDLVTHEYQFRKHVLW